MRIVLLFAIICAAACRSYCGEYASYSKRVASHFILDDYCYRDCAGYLHTHSLEYRHIFRRALQGDATALKRVFTDPHFHSGDNESWEPVPGNILFVVGDRCFAHFVSHLDRIDQKWVLMYIPIAGPFHEADMDGEHSFFEDTFPQTYRIYVARMKDKTVWR